LRTNVGVIELKAVWQDKRVINRPQNMNDRTAIRRAAPTEDVREKRENNQKSDNGIVNWRS